MLFEQLLLSGVSAHPETGRVRRNLAAVLALALLGSLAAPAAIGCSFHNVLPEPKLDGMYPGSLSVAVALRNAADKGVVDAAVLDAPRNVATLFMYTMPRLREFRKVLAGSAVAAELPASFSLGYVESGLWTRYSQSAGNIEDKIHTDGPSAREAVMLTGEPVLLAILAGDLPVERALADGLILIEGNETEKAALRAALEDTTPVMRISNR